MNILHLTVLLALVASVKTSPVTLTTTTSAATRPNNPPCPGQSMYGYYLNDLPNNQMMVFRCLDATGTYVVAKCKIYPVLTVLLNETITVANRTFLCSANGLTEITNITVSTTTLPTTTVTTTTQQPRTTSPDNRPCPGESISSDFSDELPNNSMSVWRCFDGNGTRVVTKCRISPGPAVLPNETITVENRTYLCNADGLIKISPLTTTTSTTTLPITTATTTGQPPIEDGSCIDYEEKMRKNGESWVETTYIPNWDYITTAFKEVLVDTTYECQCGEKIVTECKLLDMSFKNTVELKGKSFRCTATGLVDMGNTTTTTSTTTRQPTAGNDTCLGYNERIKQNGESWEEISYIPNWIFKSRIFKEALVDTTYECRNGEKTVVMCKLHGVSFNESAEVEGKSFKCTAAGLVDVSIITPKEGSCLYQHQFRVDNGFTWVQTQNLKWPNPADHRWGEITYECKNGTIVAIKCKVAKESPVLQNETSTVFNMTYLCTANGFVDITNTITTTSTTTLPTTTTAMKEGSCIDDTGATVKNGLKWHEEYPLENWPENFGYGYGTLVQQCVNGTKVVRKCRVMDGNLILPNETATESNKTYLCTANGLKDITDKVTTTTIATTLPTTSSTTTRQPTTTKQACIDSTGKTLENGDTWLNIQILGRPELFEFGKLSYECQNGTAVVMNCMFDFHDYSLSKGETDEAYNKTYLCTAEGLKEIPNEVSTTSTTTLPTTTSKTTGQPPIDEDCFEE